MAGAIRQAINMPAEERRRRMNRMRSVVAEHNVYRWAGNILGALSGLGELTARLSARRCLAFAEAAQ